MKHISTLTRAELIKEIAQKHNLSEAKVDRIMLLILSKIRASLAKGRRVELRKFGTWSVRQTNKRIGRNPRRPNEGTVDIPARNVVRFKPSKELKYAIEQMAPPHDKRHRNTDI